MKGLAPGTKYLVRVAGKSNYGLGEYSAVGIYATSLAPPEAPAKVRCKVTRQQVHVSWDPVPPSPRHADVASYQVTARPAAAQGKPAKDVSTTVPAEKSTCTIPDLLPGSEYSISVRSVGRSGVGHGPPSTPQTAKTTPLPAHPPAARPALPHKHPKPQKAPPPAPQQRSPPTSPRPPKKRGLLHRLRRDLGCERLKRWHGILGVVVVLIVLVGFPLSLDDRGTVRWLDK